MDLGVSYVAAHLPAHVEADVGHLRDIGCSEVLFALQENHIVTLDGAVRFGARIARDKGLRAYAVVWGYANTFGGGRMSNLLLDDPDTWRVAEDGAPVARACLNHPRVVGRFVEIAALCRDHGFEGVFVDEPTVQECFCGRCRDRFAEGYGGDLAGSRGSAAYRAFQQDTVVRYVRAVCAGTKGIDEALRTIACVIPTPPHDELFEPLAAIEEIDVLGTDPYWLLGDRLGFEMTIEDACDHARRVRAVCEETGKASQVWLNCWQIPAGREEEIYTGGRRLAGVGCDSLYTWSYRGGLGTYEECDDPATAWAGVVRLYRELAGRGGP